jgi:transposase
VLVAKYADFLPLYRQAGIFARQGTLLHGCSQNRATSKS